MHVPPPSATHAPAAGLESRVKVPAGLPREGYSEWAEKDPKNNIPVFLSVVAVPITSRSHGKDRKVKVKVMSITGRFLGPVSTCRFVVSAGLPPERP